MNIAVNVNHDRYAQCINASKRVRWDIEKDVIRNRDFDYSKMFMPSGLSRVDRLPFLNARDRLFFTQVQGRSYAYIFGLVERFINAKVLELAQTRVFGDQIELEAMLRFSDEELKHQLLFRMLEEQMEEAMLPGYVRTADPNAVAKAVLSKSTWAVLALTAHIEIFTQVHYRDSIETQADLCPLWKDVFLFHWKEESQHAILDELEWDRVDATLTEAERDAAVDDLIQLVVAVDGILQTQATADARYFLDNVSGHYNAEQQQQIGEVLLAAYRHQYIVSGVQVKRFQDGLFRKTNDAQKLKILNALHGLLQAAQ